MNVEEAYRYVKKQLGDEWSLASCRQSLVPGGHVGDPTELRIDVALVRGQLETWSRYEGTGATIEEALAVAIGYMGKVP